jgi:hypothetical protein
MAANPLPLITVILLANSVKEYRAARAWQRATVLFALVARPPASGRGAPGSSRWQSVYVASGFWPVPGNGPAATQTPVLLAKSFPRCRPAFRTAWQIPARFDADGQTVRLRVRVEGEW